MREREREKSEDKSMYHKAEKHWRLMQESSSCLVLFVRLEV